jgi:hypothetical protein
VGVPPAALCKLSSKRRASLEENSQADEKQEL